MTSNHSQTEEFAKSSDAEAARSRFLDSIGLGAASSSIREEQLRTRRSEEEEEVALSSQPDDLELPGVKPAAPRNTEEPREPIMEKAEETQIAELENFDDPEIESSPEPRTFDPSEQVLTLKCPSCDGELALKREHVGVAGMCVWCDTPIVAAASPEEGEVRVFAIGTAARKESTEADSETLEDADEPFEEIAPLPEPENATALVQEVSVEPESDLESHVPDEILESGGWETEGWVEENKEGGETESFSFSGWSGDSGPVREETGSEEAEETAPEPFISDSEGWFSGEATPREEKDDSQATDEKEPVSEEKEEEDASEGIWGVSFAGIHADKDSEEDDVPGGFGSFLNAPRSDSDDAESHDDRAPQRAPMGFAAMWEPSGKFTSEEDNAPAAIQAEPESHSAEKPVVRVEKKAPTASGFAGSVSWEIGPPKEKEKEPGPEGEGESARALEPLEETAEEPPAGFRAPMPASLDEIEAEPSRDADDVSEIFAGFEPFEAPSSEAKDEELAPDFTAFAPADFQPDVARLDEGETEVASVPWGFPAQKPDLRESQKTEAKEAGFAAATGEHEDPDRAPSPDFGFSFQPESEESEALSPFETPGADKKSTPAALSGFDIPEFSNGDSIFGTAASEEPSPESPLSAAASPDESSSLFGELSTPPPPPRAEAPVEGLPASSPWGQSPPFHPLPAESRVETDSSPFSGEDDGGGKPSSIFGTSQPLSAPPLFPSAEPKQATPSPFGVPDTTGQPRETLPPPAPPASGPASVVSKPLSSQSRKGKKGLVVLLVMFLGLICGGALASFVLPVDEYVQKAKTFIEEKLNLAPAEPIMPEMPPAPPIPAEEPPAPLVPPVIPQ